MARKLLALGIVIAAVAIYILTRPEVRPGKKIFKSEGCISCHNFKGIGYGTVDLSNVTRRRTDVWIKDHIRNPRLHDPKIGMPSFGYLPDEEIDALVKFLHSEP